MRTRPKMLMNQDGGSPGGGAPTPPAPPAPAPAQPPATPAAPEAANVSDQVKAAVSEAIVGLRNGLFADLRKAGVFKDGAPPKPPTAGPKPAGTAEALSMADVTKLLERDRVITRLAAKHSLNDAQLGRMQRALAADNPEDVQEWATSYATDMSFSSSGPPAPPVAAGAPPAGQQQRQADPISDRGGANGARDFESIRNPYELTKTDIARMQEKLGFDAANKKITELTMRYLADKKLGRDPDPR